MNVGNSDIAMERPFALLIGLTLSLLLISHILLCANATRRLKEDQEEADKEAIHSGIGNDVESTATVAADHDRGGEMREKVNKVRLGLEDELVALPPLPPVPLIPPFPVSSVPGLPPIPLLPPVPLLPPLPPVPGLPPLP